MMPVDWKDLEEAFYDDAAAEQLLLAARRSPGIGRPDPWIDRNAHLLFDGAGSLDARRALLHGFVFERAPQATALLVRAILRAAMDCGVVEFEDRSDGPRFRLRRPGVVFVARSFGVVDTAKGEILRRGPSLASLMAKEQRVRATMAERHRKALLNGLWILREVERNAPVPRQLIGKDHPPATTMGEFADLLPGFLDLMPTWRVGEMAWVFQCLPRVPPSIDPPLRRLIDLDEVERLALAPPELRDLQL